MRIPTTGQSGILESDIGPHKLISWSAGVCWSRIYGAQIARRDISYEWSLEDHLISLQPLFLFCQYHSTIKPLEQIVYPVRLQKDHWKKLQQL